MTPEQAINELCTTYQRYGDHAEYTIEDIRPQAAAYNGRKIDVRLVQGRDVYTWVKDICGDPNDCQGCGYCTSDED